MMFTNIQGASRSVARLDLIMTIIIAEKKNSNQFKEDHLTVIKVRTASG